MSWNPYPAPEVSSTTPPETAIHAPLAARETPTLLETVAFFTLAAILLVGVQGAGVVAAMHWHLFGKLTLKQLAYTTRFTIPTMFVSYAFVLLATMALFGRVWSRNFFEGIHWNFPRVRQYWPFLFVLGIGLGFGVQAASNYLPVPKELPVDAFLRSPVDAWMVALFGVLIAPIAEEIAFRGFLYPSLRRWTGAAVAAVLASVPFALLHAQQVAHAWGPLAMVFLVSVILCTVRDRTGSVAASALVHASYNLSIFAAIFYTSGGFMHLERLKD